MYIEIMHCWPVTGNIRTIATYATFLQSAIPVSMHVLERACNINRCLFRRLKINHDTHEFILDPGTIANSYCSISYVASTVRYVSK
jgi:hypothetical protein